MGSPRRVHKLVHLLTWVSTVSALSLANFQIVISNAIPSTCIKAYSHPIHGCFIRDFKGGALCSSKCTNGLLQAEARIDAACEGVDVNRDTLLGIALRGDLVATLCPGVIVAPSSTTVTVTVPARTSQSSSTQTLSPPSPPPLPPAPPPPLPPAFTTRTTLTTSTTAETTPPRSTSVPETTSRSTQTSTQAQTSVVETTAAPPPSSATPTNANTPLPQTTATETSRPNGGGRPPLIGGGGSPFDQPVVGSGRSAYTVRWTEAIWAALSATLIILW